MELTVGVYQGRDLDAFQFFDLSPSPATLISSPYFSFQESKERHFRVRSETINEKEKKRGQKGREAGGEYLTRRCRTPSFEKDETPHPSRPLEPPGNDAVRSPSMGIGVGMEEGGWIGESLWRAPIGEGSARTVGRHTGLSPGFG